MPKALVLIWGFIFAISTSAYGQESFTVSVEISFQEEKGQLYVSLRTQEEHELFIKPATPAGSLIIKPNQQQLQAKKVTFKFVDVPGGTYCIYCLHDLNKNGKMDRVPKTGLPTEPYGYSGPLFFGKAMWEDVSFKVEKNISGIKIKLQAF